MIKPAICCLGYNRPDSMKRLLDSIGRANYVYEDITLIISIDECDKSDAVEEVAQHFQWKYGEKIIKRYENRLGTKAHTYLCGDLSIEYGALIYLEDDVIVASDFYNWTVSALKYYKDDNRILGIALYSQKWLFAPCYSFHPAYDGSDAYLFRGDVSWGQCWIGESWEMFKRWRVSKADKMPSYNKEVPAFAYDWPEKSSWSREIEFFLAENEYYYVVPYYSLSTCMSDAGVHTDIGSNMCQVPLAMCLNKQYTFKSVSDSIKYDASYERIGLEISNIPPSDLCVDLNGIKYDWEGYKYILTIKKLPYELVASYGNHLEPIECNILCGIHGEDIRFYRIPEDYISPRKVPLKCITTNVKKEQLLTRYSLKYLIKYTLRRSLNKIKARLPF